jgi:hypothetical protein
MQSTRERKDFIDHGYLAIPVESEPYDSSTLASQIIIA